MKDISQLAKDLDKFKARLSKELIQAQKNTAIKIQNDARNLAPGTGKYASSIHVTPTKSSSKQISTKIVSNLTVTAKSNGNTYNLGFLLENGTGMHAIPNAFGWGDIFGYDSAMYKRTLQPDWHPGFEAIPHFKPALNKNKRLYKEEIAKAIERAFYG